MEKNQHPGLNILQLLIKISIQAEYKWVQTLGKLLYKWLELDYLANEMSTIVED